MRTHVAISGQGDLTPLVARQLDDSAAFTTEGAVIDAVLMLDGAPFNLGTGTVNFKMRDASGNLQTIACTVLVAASGSVRVRLQATNLQTPGAFDCCFVFTTADEVLTFPNERNLRMIVKEALA